MSIKTTIATLTVITAVAIPAAALAASHRHYAADINRDGAVNSTDLSILLSNWHKSGRHLAGDLNHDGTVNIYDLSVFLTQQAQYNKSAA